MPSTSGCLSRDFHNHLGYGNWETAHNPLRAREASDELTMGWHRPNLFLQPGPYYQGVAVE